ncbi:MAG: hypothetical protein ACRCTU_18730 [Zoogloea sp.]|uniref:hypothetical protein n=1 Tax=Zoogloea sp. TaxID=49181 RepID=UPI003F2F3D03
MKPLRYALAFIVLLLAASAHAQVVVVANKSIPVEKLNADQTTQIFLKQTQTWPDGQPIYPVDIKEGSTIRAEFYGKVTGRTSAQMRAYWARQAFTGMGFPPKQVESADDVIKLVQATPGAIGYVSRKPTESPVKVVLEQGP